MSGGISSSFTDGPADEPFCETTSVDAVPALPLRVLDLYFCIASASRSSIRVAIGESTLERLLAELTDGDGTENVLAVPADVEL